MNKRIRLIILASFIIGFINQARSQNNLTQFVNPFIGTDGFGHTFPGATLPFGMVQMSPDTRTEGWENCSGYHSSNPTIIGFSHTHLSGTGAADYGDIMFMPTIGRKLSAGDEKHPMEGYRSAFNHNTEKARPGYYSVLLEDEKILAEMTASLRSGLQRYTFPLSDSSSIILDLDHGISDKTTGSLIIINDRRSVSGFRQSSGWAKDHIIYFYSEFSEEFYTSEITDLKGTKITSIKSGLSTGQVARFVFKTIPGKRIVVRTGISTVSIENAHLNLDTETKGKDFDEIVKEADSAWNRELSRIQVEGGTQSDKTSFYTALYHCMTSPNIMSDVDGSYRGMDKQVHMMEKGKMYTVFSLWDTFRALHPLFTIIDPERAQEFVRSLLQKFRESGTLPVWELASNETGCMIGYHAVPVIADAYMKGLRDFDTTLALNASIKSSMMDQLGLKYYKKQGYIPADKENESVSKTLEYAYDDWCISKMAQAMGRTNEEKIFSRRAISYQNVFDAGTGFMRGKKNSNWTAPFDPYEVSGIYTEANAWQYTWFIPHDIEGMIRINGGQTTFTSRLDSLFSATTKITGRSQPDISGMIGQYAHGNEPSHHMAYLYNYSNKPWRTTDITRKIMQDFYSNKRDGLAGNEDCGQMSAWYVFSAMGFYPVCPGSNLYDCGSPLFNKITIDPGNGKQYIIVADKKKPSDIYPMSIKVNGTSSGLQFSHEDLIKGGEIRFTLSSQPEQTLKPKPATATNDSGAVMMPFLRSCERSFFDSCTIAMGCYTEGAEIRFTRNGSEPNRKSELYTQPIRIDSTTTIKMTGYKNGYAKSFTDEATFIRLPYKKTVTYLHPFSHNYTAGGMNGLVDGIKAEPGAFGSWQGFQGDDFEAVVDLGEKRNFSSISTNYLQNYPSWIWLPSEVRYSVSDDGKNFREVFYKKTDIPQNQDGSIINEYKMPESKQSARFVKVTAKNIGKCPSWHPGSGNPSWIFIDEITIE